MQAIPSFIGKVRYLVDNTRPDLLATLGILAEGGSNTNLQNKHSIIKLEMIKDFYQYLKQEKEVYKDIQSSTCLRLGRHDPNLCLFGFCDASYITKGDSRSRLGACFFISKDSGSVLTLSKKDTTVSHSSTEAEIKAIDMAIRSIIYLRNLLQELGFKQINPTKLYVDNKSAIQICNTLKADSKVKHINIRIHYIREQINAGNIELIFIPTTHNVADVLTKPLPKAAYVAYRNRLLHGFGNHDIDELDKLNYFWRKKYQTEVTSNELETNLSV
jgi:hypothetical protein